jgi:hypothetical protein
LTDINIRREGAEGLLLNATSVDGAVFSLKDVEEFNLFKDSTGRSASVCGISEPLQ